MAFVCMVCPIPVSPILFPLILDVNVRQQYCLQQFEK